MAFDPFQAIRQDLVEVYNLKQGQGNRSQQRQFWVPNLQENMHKQVQRVRVEANKQFCPNSNTDTTGVFKKRSNLQGDTNY